MTRITLFDLESDHLSLRPLTFTRAISGLRIGMLTIAEKWKYYFPESEIQTHTVAYLQAEHVQEHQSLWINASILPDNQLIEAIKSLGTSHALYRGDILVAFHGVSIHSYEYLQSEQLLTNISKLSYPWDLFEKNPAELCKDFELVTRDRMSQPLADPHTITYGDQIFIEEGTDIKAAVLNSETGPIYIGKNATVQEGTMIKGPFALCEGAITAMGTKIRGKSTIGPFCKAGGEISNSIMMAYSNKGHDGFLGNSVLGEWCNLGADTNTSNLKNNYKDIRVWNYQQNDFIDSKRQFCGLIMGDHSKAGINTMFNTGTVVGVASNIFGGGFPDKHVPSFAWGGADGLIVHEFEKAIETAQLVLARRNMSLTEEQIVVLKHIFDNFAVKV